MNTLYQLILTITFCLKWGGWCYYMRLYHRYLPSNRNTLSHPHIHTWPKSFVRLYKRIDERTDRCDWTGGQSNLYCVTLFKNKYILTIIVYNLLTEMSMLKLTFTQE